MSAVLTSTTSTSSKPEAKYGLPQDVRFCVRCVMSNQRPSSTVEYSHVKESKKQTIHFDEAGVCDACRVAENKGKVDWEERRGELDDLCSQERSKKGNFDCIVPGSGGKDSFYAAHILATRFKMHPALVTWGPHIFTDWGWRNLVRWQDIASHTLVMPKRSVHRLLTRLAVENLFHPFQPFIIGQKALAPKLAALYKIPLVFYGENEAEYGDPKGNQDKAKRSSAYHAPSGPLYLSGVSVDELKRKHKLTEADLDPYMPLAPEQANKVEVCYLGFFLKWHPQSCYYYACQHGNFEPSPHRTPGTYSTYSSIDDKLDDLHYRTSWIKFGIGRATYDAAQEVRSGDITREEAVALVHRFDGEWPGRFESELFDYLSVDGFVPMTREHWAFLEEKAKSPHLWDGDKLRHTVWNASGEK